MSERDWHPDESVTYTTRPPYSPTFRVDNRGPWVILRGKPTLRQLLRYWWKNR